MTLDKKRLLFITFFALAVVVLLLAALPEDNEGKPGNNTTGEKNCGLNNVDCHDGDEDSTLSVETAANSEDHNLFVAPIYKDGEKLKDTEFKNQAKAVAISNSDDYINYLDTSDNEDELDLTSHGPTDGEKFWVGFGYMDEFDTIHVWSQNEAYTYEKENTPPVPKAKISVESDFPDDAQKTIEIDEASGSKTLTTALSKDGRATVYFTGRESTDDDAGDELTYYWDIDGDDKFETNGTGDDLDERGKNYVYNYTEAKTYNLKFKVADGTTESSALEFKVTVEETEEKPELHPLEIIVEDEDGNAATEFEKGDAIEIKVDVENKDDSGYGAGTDAAVGVKFYYAKGSESYNTWYELETTDTGSKLNDNDKKTIFYSWDTTDVAVGSYKIKAVVDEDNAVNEWDEDNNEEIFDAIIDVEEPAQEGSPIVSFTGDIIFEYTGDLKENTEVTIDVTIQNNGDGEAQSVQVIFFIDGTEKTRSPGFNIGVGESKKLSEFTQAFSWSPSTQGSYDIKLKYTYYHGGSEDSGEISADDVEVAPATTNGGTNGNGNGGEEDHEDDEGGFMPGFGIMTAVVAVAIAALEITRKKRA